ncbi:MAG: hypothetical protein JNL60_14865 [Bacteroidia bacterium]|nr:hypothetical protein [Bacteroidia bacterium]
MKNSTITWLLSFFFLVSCFKSVVAGTPTKDTTRCVEIDGIIGNASLTKGDECLVELICFNKVEETVVLKNGKKRFKLNLKKNAFYTIKMSKKGHVTRTIIIDTRIAESEYEGYFFSFETKLLPESQTDALNKEILSQPIALVYFDQKKDCFVYDKEYTSRLKKEIVSK